MIVGPLAAVGTGRFLGPTAVRTGGAVVEVTCSENFEIASKHKTTCSRPRRRTRLFLGRSDQRTRVGALQNLFGGWIFSRDTVVEVPERRSNDSCSGATGGVQKPFCTRSTKSQAVDSPPNRFSIYISFSAAKMDPPPRHWSGDSNGPDARSRRLAGLCIAGATGGHAPRGPVGEVGLLGSKDGLAPFN